MEVEGAAAINKKFWGIMGRLWSDNPHERHEASDHLRKYTIEHKIHVDDVSQTVDRKNKPDWQLRSEAVSLRKTVEILEAEVQELRRARAPEDPNTADAAELRRAKAELEAARTALEKERHARRAADAALHEAEARLTRLNVQFEQSEARVLDLKRQIQTQEAHAHSLRADLARANEFQEALEHALTVATDAATSYQRELFQLKMEQRQAKMPPIHPAAASEQSRPRFALFARR